MHRLPTMYVCTTSIVVPTQSTALAIPTVPDLRNTCTLQDASLVGEGGESQGEQGFFLFLVVVVWILTWDNSRDFFGWLVGFNFYWDNKKRPLHRYYTPAQVSWLVNNLILPHSTCADTQIRA